MADIFNVLDFETANERLDSICQIGLVKFENNKIVETYKTHIDPQDYFASINICIHGITENHVKNAPIFSDIYDKIMKFIDDDVVITHTYFDRTAWNRTISRYNLPVANIRWLDSSMIARRTWEEYEQGGWGLANIAADEGISFKHHDALEDAKTAGAIVLRAIDKTGLSIQEWEKRVKQPLHPAKPLSAYEPNMNGKLYGQTIVFTGALQSMNRADATQLASESGCRVSNTINKDTNMLILGEQDMSKLKGFKKSSKHRKVEKLVNDGQKIKVLLENQFISIIEEDTGES